MEIDERDFSIGLDMDTDEREVQPGYYRYGRNGRSGTSEQDFKKSVEALRGNMQRNTILNEFGEPIPYPYPDGTNRVVGFAEDIRNLSVIFMLWNSNGNHRLIRYSVETTLLSNIIPLTWVGQEYLQWTRYDKIWNAKVVYGHDQDWIIWTNNIGEIKKIRLDIGTAYVNLAISALEPQLIDFPKRPPNLPPTLELVTQDDTVSFIAGKGWQFIYQYVYDDDSLSIWSPISDVMIVDSVATAIRVSFNTGHFTVKAVNIAVREGNGSSATGTTVPQWYTIYTLRAQGNDTIATYDFLNTELRTAVARIDTDKLFEAIPDHAGCMEMADTNQLVVGDITQGKDNPTITASPTDGILAVNNYNIGPLGGNDTVLEATYVERQYTIDPLIIPEAKFQMISPPTLIKSGVLFDDDTQVSFYKTYPTGPIFAEIIVNISMEMVVVGTLSADIRVDLVNDGNVISTETYIVGGAPPQPFSFFHAVKTFLVQSGAVYVVVTYLGLGGTGAVEVLADSTIQVNIINAVVPTFKDNGQARLGIVYFDDFMRSGGVIKIETVPFTPIEGIVGDISDTHIYAPFVELSIRNRPPVWAKYYAIVMKETQVGFGWFTMSNVDNTSGKTVFTYDFMPAGFEAQKGDYIRIIGFNVKPNKGFYAVVQPGEYTPLLVDSVDTSTKTITINGNYNLDNDYTWIVEIYRNVQKPDIYFETKLFEIGDPGLATRYHKADIQNQDPNNPMVPAQTNIYGDLYFRYNTEFPVYTPYYNEGFESNYWNRGRVEIFVENMKSRRYFNFGRWGGKLLPATQINNLAVFDEGNIFSVDQKFGTIKGMRQLGYTMKIIQEKNANSAYINRREIQNADGSTQLAVTDSLIGTINPSTQGYGTMHAGSLVRYGNALFYFDQINGMMIRDSGEGGYPISNYGAQRKFREWGEMCTDAGNNDDGIPFFDVIAGVDGKTRYIYISLVEQTDDYSNKSETLSFFEPKESQPINQWKFFHDYALTDEDDNEQPLDMYMWVGQYALTCINGLSWEQNVLEDEEGNPIYLRFFGQDRPFIITGVENMLATKVKTGMYHSMHVNRNVDNTIFRIMDSTMYSNGMESQTNGASYSYKEAIYYAAIKRDAFTKGVPLTDEARRLQIASGRPLKGNSMTYQMTWNGNDYVVLFSSGIGVNPSEKS